MLETIELIVITLMCCKDPLLQQSPPQSQASRCKAVGSSTTLTIILQRVFPIFCFTILEIKHQHLAENCSSPYSSAQKNELLII